MKRVKWITVLSSLLACCAVAFCFTATGAYTTKADTADYIIKSSGIALTDAVDSGVSIKYGVTANRDQTYGTTYATFAFKLSETIDASSDGDYDGLLIKMANPSSNNVKLVNYLVSQDSIGRCSSTTEKGFKTFIDDTGVNLANDNKGLKWEGGYYSFTANTSGTFNLNFADIKSGRPSMNEVSEVVFGIRMDEALIEGTGFTVGTIAGYKADSDAVGGYQVKVLYDADAMSVTTDQTVTTADINLADMSKGKTVYMKGCTNSSNSYVTENADVINAWAMGYLDAQIKQYGVTVNCIDSNGVILANPTVVNVYAGREYQIIAPEIPSFEYVSVDGSLTGKANGNVSLVLTYSTTATVNAHSLTVKFVDGSNQPLKQDLVVKYLSGVDYEVSVPEFRGYVFENAVGDLQGTITADTTITLNYNKKPTNWNVSDVEWDVSDSGESLYIKGSLFKGVQFMNKEQMTLISDDATGYGRTILGLTKFNFNQTINAINGDWDGLLIRIENVSDKPLKFSAYLLNGENIARNFVSADARYESFVDTTGYPIDEMEKGIQLAQGYFTFSAGASGTWNYDFSTLQTGKENMSAVDSFAIGLRQGDTTFMGKGIVISSIAAYKADESYENGYYVETIFNAKDLTVSTTENDATADLNLVSTDLGRIVNTNVYNINNTNKFVAEEYRQNLHATTLNNVRYEQRGYVVKINAYDMDGDLLKTEIKNYQPGEAYTIVPYQITNYVFKNADEELSGEITSDMEINLYYDLASYDVTIKFVDANGNKIKDDVVKTYFAGDYINIENLDEFVIEGFEYKSATGRLKFTVVRDTVITITYEKLSGCSSNVTADYSYVLVATVIIAGAVILLRKRNAKR